VKVTGIISIKQFKMPGEDGVKTLVRAPLLSQETAALPSVVML